MEDVPKVNEPLLLPVDLPVHPHLLDHRSEGRVVLPAVAAMEILATAVKRECPGAGVRVIRRASFPKFLHIDPNVAPLPVSVRVREGENGDLGVSLLSRRRSGALAITRTLEHATLWFPKAGPGPALPAGDPVPGLETGCFEIPSERVYRDLVPFGAAFQNVRGSLRLSRAGAVARVFARPVEAGPGEPSPLGSPFPLDGAFHAACAWGQRYAKVVAFPVAIEERVVWRPTTPGATYLARVFPVRTGPDLLTFSIRIYDEGGDLRESASGVAMRDVSAGRMKPPGWVVERNAQ